MNPLFASAVKSMQAGDLAEAERLCRAILATEPNDVPSIHLLGFLAYRSGRLDTAIDLIGQAIRLDESNPDCHFNIALALLAARRWQEAVTHVTRAIELKPDYAMVVSKLVDLSYTQANQALEQGRLADAMIGYQQVVALKPDFAEAHSNLGVALMAQGHAAEAAVAYRRAIAINPKLVTVYRNLGRVLAAQGDAIGALGLARTALGVEATDDIKRFFVQSVRNLPPTAVADPVLDGIAPLLTRAVTEGWGRPVEMAGLALALIKRQLATDDVLLHALLDTAPVCDRELERWLTQERRRLLLDAGHDDLPFACALARQCFLNEYVFAQDEQEVREAAKLRDAVAAGSTVSPAQLAVLAAYMPLHTLPDPARLFERKWPQSLEAVLDQQVREPLREREDRKDVPVLSAIEDPVSRLVREQYEEMPYPCWVKAPLMGTPIRIDDHVRGQFRLAPFRPLGKTGSIDILVAGCGTGEHPIATARQYANARVLAVDLSLSSLCYARRMTRALGLTNIEYAQADILKLGDIGRTFDVIESVGALHHLADPQAGWRVLLSLLRPGGLMLVGLYSRHARQDVTLARDFIAQRGYGSSADDIRRCRQELLALDDAAPLRSVTRQSDFYATSTCRDLLFHVQEHQFTIPDIKAFLTANGLTFIGFVADPLVQQYYRGRFPNDVALTDLDCWDAVEADNPQIFRGMYQFWTQKA